MPGPNGDVAASLRLNFETQEKKNVKYLMNVFLCLLYVEIILLDILG